MRDVNNTYTKYIAIEKGEKVLHTRLTNALYRCMQSAMLWYVTFKGYLEGMNFKINPYNPCVANNMIDGKQYTIL